MIKIITLEISENSNRISLLNTDFGKINCEVSPTILLFTLLVAFVATKG